MPQGLTAANACIISCSCSGAEVFTCLDAGSLLWCQCKAAGRVLQLPGGSVVPRFSETRSCRLNSCLIARVLVAAARMPLLLYL